ncbi:hypothetical protein GO600_07280 [Thermus antranikianii]|uniref:PucR family transcriptional regulator n=2 Tax=Thermus antranikianii TaxID=88190 RepID=A0ABY7RQE0_9DEIN|nr:hypothetical protein GO600_07280 [Thermus antranikianii]
MGALHRTLWSWAETMAWHYAQEIPDYARLDTRILERDVAVVSFEYLRALEEGGNVEDLALAVGQRRRSQGVSLPALLRAYRLWAKDALEALKDSTPNRLAELAPRVVELLDRVSEASAQGYRLALEGRLPRGSVVGIGVGFADAGAMALAPRHLSLPSEAMFYEQSPFGALLFLAAPLAEVEQELRGLARKCQAVLWVEEGTDASRVGADLEEALALGSRLRLPPGLYPTRYLWPLAIALDSPKGRERLLRLLAPLELHPELLATLEVYLQSGFSLKKTAHRLGLHPNSVLYRLHRAEELTGLHLGRAEDLCLVSMALYLYRAVGD